MPYDALVIGGGPGGSTVATLLARAGKRVLALEKEHFPRFHIGESLLPYNRRIFEEMGVLPQIEAAGFPIKYGAQFHLGNSSAMVKLVFRSSCFSQEATAFQVERAKFDHLLLNHARSCGAEVREGWSVTGFEVQPEKVVVKARDENGKTESFEAAFLIDASGRSNLTGNQERLRVIHPRLKKLAVFAHFENVLRDSGSTSSDILVVRLKDKWFWVIPISATKTSVGCVLDAKEYADLKRSPAEVFAMMKESSAEMRTRMRSATPVGQFYTTTDFSYYNRRLASPRLLRVGDAAGFMDPVFSAGVYMAMYSGSLASRVVLDSLAAGDTGGRRLAAYERKVFQAMRFYWKMVEEFYTTPFIELLMQPRPKWQLPDAILAILAGEFEGGWAMRWRRALFFLLVKLQAIRPVVPRLSLD